MTHRIIQGPYILRPKDRIFKVDIFLKNGTVYIQLWTVYFPLMTVYFELKTVYFPPGPYISPRPYIFKDRIFYFSGPYILLSNRQNPTNSSKFYITIFDIISIIVKKFILLTDLPCVNISKSVFGFDYKRSGITHFRNFNWSFVNQNTVGCCSL